MIRCEDLPIQCFVDGKPVKCAVLRDDTARDAALKMTLGRGQVYLYAKRTRTTTPVTVWQKYKRPLTPAELTGELRNVGILRRVEVKAYDFEDVLDYFPKEALAEYVPVGQHLPLGVRAKPPKNGYTLDEYKDAVVTDVAPKTRLYEYGQVTELHAVHLNYLTQTYRLHPPGLVSTVPPLPCEANWRWTYLEEAGYDPVAPQSVNLQLLFQRAHAHPQVPTIVYGNLAKVHGDFSKEVRPGKTDRVTFYFAHGAWVAFCRDASVEVGTDDPALNNPLINYVNNIVQFGTGVEGDYQCLGKRVEKAPLFSDAVFPLCTKDRKVRRSISAEWRAQPETVPIRWSCVFGDDFTYKRCGDPTKTQIEFCEDRVVVRGIPEACAPYAALYVEAYLSEGQAQGQDPTGDEAECAIEEADEAEEVAFKCGLSEVERVVEKLERGGFQVNGRYLEGVEAVSFSTGLEGLVPCAVYMNGHTNGHTNGNINGNINGNTSEDGVNVDLPTWTPRQGYAKTLAFLEEVSIVLSHLGSITPVVDVSAKCTGFKTGCGFVPCLPDKTPQVPLITEHELHFPTVPRLYGIFREMCRRSPWNKSVLERVPVCVSTSSEPWCRDGKLFLSEGDLHRFALKLERELATNQRVRCYVNKWTQQVKRVDHDLFPEEKIVFL